MLKPLEEVLQRDVLELLVDPEWDWLLLNVISGDLSGDDPEVLKRLTSLSSRRKNLLDRLINNGVLPPRKRLYELVVNEVRKYTVKCRVEATSETEARRLVDTYGAVEYEMGNEITEVVSADIASVIVVPKPEG